MKRIADFLAYYIDQNFLQLVTMEIFCRELDDILRNIKTYKAPILIATSVAARGLYKSPKVKNVVNYDMPICIEEYVHGFARAVCIVIMVNTYVSIKIGILITLLTYSYYKI